MKVLIFSLAYTPFIGGAEVAVKEITDRIDGVEFELLTVNLDGAQKSEEKIGTVLVHRLGSGKLAKYFFPWTAFRAAARLHRTKQFDAVWAIMANQAGLAAAKFKKKFPEVKYLLTLQEGDSLASIWARTWFMRPAYKNIYRRADRIQAISNYLKQRAVKYGYRGPVDVVPNGIAWLSQRDRRRRDGFIVSVSRLTKKNGLADLILAMQWVQNATLVLVGGGELEQQLKRLAHRLRLAHRVRFVGSVNYQEVHTYLSEASVFVRPSLSEGLGSAFLEAMGDMVPVVATPVGGIPDFLVDGKTGWFCGVKNPKSIAEKINFILDPANATTVDRVVAAAYEMVSQRYQWERVAKEMNDIIQHL